MALISVNFSEFFGLGEFCDFIEFCYFCNLSEFCGFSEFCYFIEFCYFCNFSDFFFILANLAYLVILAIFYLCDF